ncbi:MAG: Flp pilus assembly complex ATPase component TadA [Acidobacteria bacterium]|nr:Flp pilus assembly complex ATPase component TadA [Acidobacteriota bacterium]MBV9625164.1 Flp pilus assembly complex ATPase component TadA [Acidobacteriota bacterium]
MATPGSAPIHISLDPTSSAAGIDELLAAILRASPRVSDLIFSPGRTPQIEAHGRFLPIQFSGQTPLTADDTRRVAAHLIGNNKAAIAMLREQGYCDISYGLAGLARFRVNVFIQRGSCAVVMRVIPTTIPELKTLGAPEELGQAISVGSGLVLVTGPRGCGKSSTLAALVNHINDSEPCHIITIEDPIEFLHCHKQATVHQRELRSDTPTISHALRAALRQAPQVIVVGALEDRETMELALEAAETGHLVLSALNAPTAAKAVERFVSVFPTREQTKLRDRLGRMLLSVVCQRLIPRKQDGERIAVYEVARGNLPLKSFDEPDAAAGGTRQASETSTLDSQIEQLVRRGIITPRAALVHATDPAELAHKLSTYDSELG